MATVWFLVLVCGILAVVVMHSLFLAMCAIFVGIVLTVLHKEMTS